MPRNYRICLEDMSEAGEKARRYVEGLSLDSASGILDAKTYEEPPMVSPFEIDMVLLARLMRCTPVPNSGSLYDGVGCVPSGSGPDLAGLAVSPSGVALAFVSRELR